MRASRTYGAGTITSRTALKSSGWWIQNDTGQLRKPGGSKKEGTYAEVIVCGYFSQPVIWMLVPEYPYSP
jgi:hypothetical protein